MACVADDDELATTFNQMKAALAHVLDQSVAADLAFDVYDRPADDTPTPGSFCAEYLFAPLRIRIIAAKRLSKNLHPPISTDLGKKSVKA